MNEITWLSHGGPGSGRYPKGSGKKYLKSNRKKIRGKAFIDGMYKAATEVSVWTANKTPKGVQKMANTIGNTNTVNRVFNFYDRVMSVPVKNISKKHPGVGYAMITKYNSYLKDVQKRTGLNKNAIRIAAMG